VRSGLGRKVGSVWWSDPGGPCGTRGSANRPPVCLFVSSWLGWRQGTWRAGGILHSRPQDGHRDGRVSRQVA
jgi:hypothetical protein